MKKNQPKEEPKRDTTKSYLSFKLGDEFFALPVTKVLEILEVPKITKVPKSPGYLKGVVNLRGEVLPVIDKRIKFGMSPTEFRINTSLLVVNVQEADEVLTACVLVDSVVEVFEISDEEIKPSPSIGSKYRADFIEGVINHKEEFVMLLDIDQIFSLNEIKNMVTKPEAA